MFELKIDLHVHTNYSDSASSIEEILKSAREKGLDGIAITDHGNMLAMKEVFEQATDLIIIPGIEVKTPEGHILVLGLKTPPPQRLNAVKVAEYVRNSGGVVIIAHPNTPFHSFNEEIIKSIKPDAIETHNAKTPFSKWMIRRNIKLAERLGLPQIGGSDSHIHQTVGDMYTIINSNSKKIGDVLKAIRKGRVRPAGKPSHIWKRLVWFAKTLYNKMRAILKFNALRFMF